MLYPKIIKRNHRRRGPIESLKINNFNNCIENAIKELDEDLTNSNKKLKTLMEDIHISYNSEQVKQITKLNNLYKAIIGGESIE